MNHLKRAFNLILVVIVLSRSSSPAQESKPVLRALPSQMLLDDYERQVLYPWLFNRSYAKLGWKVDSRVRDTGPFIQRQNLGTHPAVRIYYSPEVVKWLKGNRSGTIPDGAVIVKEMFLPPSSIYEEVRQFPYFQKHPQQFEKMLSEKLLTGWAVMIKDCGGKSADGWFWSSPASKPTLEKMLAPESGNVDDYSHVLTSGFGVGTCIRCHASAEKENTFSSQQNFAEDETPLQYRVDNSWRDQFHLKDVLPVIHETLAAGNVPEHEIDRWLATLKLPPEQRPWAAEAPMFELVPSLDAWDHTPDAINIRARLQTIKDECTLLKAPGNTSAGNPFDQFFKELVSPQNDICRFRFPFEYADHVYPGPAAEKGGTTNPYEYVTSDNCYGCHGGLGGAPYPLSMFVQKGPKSGDGYNISEYGEWRWSPMGLAGRDPIFHAQLESEMIILLKENGQLKGGKPAAGNVRTTQQALVDTCLRCHGAMGLRQSGINQGGNILNPHFDPYLFYIDKPLTEEQQEDPPFQRPAHTPFPPSPLSKAQFYDSWHLGNLAREGISCTVCHHIAPPDKNVAKNWVTDIREKHPGWIGSDKDVVWTKSFFYFLGVNNTGLNERGPSNDLYGPFKDVKEKPMKHAMGITPKIAPSMDMGTFNADPNSPFVATSEMCGTCHAINLPNIGSEKDRFPVLTSLEPNQHFKNLPHSIEQATYLEWLNSSYGPGKDNVKGENFQSCQDCHMPNRFKPLDNSFPELKPLVSQIASIQDSSYPQSDHQLPTEDIYVKLRSDYRRHELVGLNAFLVEMFIQFPYLLGVNDGKDYETGASNGAQFAIDNMLLSAKEGRVATVEVGRPVVEGGNLVVDVAVTNKTGHRFPSGVSFRRAWVELLVFDENNNVIWGSGQTNPYGLIVDNDGKPLVTEFLEHKKNPHDKLAQYQPNYQKITSDQQVQIYEELITNKDNEFTTSFIHRIHHIKDNRLLPHGWVTPQEFSGLTPDAGIEPQGKLLLEFIEATNPEGDSVLADKDFTTSPSDGTDRLQYAIPLTDLRGKPAAVKATIYSQSYMPAWFYQRFSLARQAQAAGYKTPAAARLFAITQHLDLEKTAIKNWKMKIGSSGKKPVEP